MNKIILKTTLNSGVELLQDSKSKMLNVTALFDSANKQLNLNRRVEDWVKSPKTTELFEYRKSLKLGESYKKRERYDTKMKRIFTEKTNGIEGCETNIRLEDSKYIYDAGNVRLNVLIEFDGGEHSTKDDEKKNKLAEERGFSLFRISIEPQIDLVVDILKRIDNGEKIDTEKFNKERTKFVKHCISVISPGVGETDNQSLTKQQEKEIENQILKVTKSRQTKDGWVKGNVLADDVMALDAASYLDVALKNEIYEYYLDDKAKVRNKMTEDYKKLCSVISRNISSESETFRSVCHHINGIVFDKFISNLWNNDCTKEQYTELDDIMIKLIGLIEDGYVDTLTKLYKKLEEWYEKKWKHSMFSEIKC